MLARLGKYDPLMVSRVEPDTDAGVSRLIPMLSINHLHRSFTKGHMAPATALWKQVCFEGEFQILSFDSLPIGESS